MSWIKEFKDFASKGNLVDVAVAFVMGIAFGKVISSLTEGIVSPFIGLLTGGVDFTDKQFVLRAGKKITNDTGEIIKETPELVVKYGVFLMAAIDFLIVAFVMFLIVKAVNNIRKKQELAPAPPPTPSTTDLLLMEIRDSLKKG